MIGFILRPLRNVRRKRFSNRIEWIYLDLDSDLPERNPPKHPWLVRKILGDLIPEPHFTLESIHDDLQRLKRLKKLKGIVIHVRQVPSGMARLQSLRQLLEEFKDSGKQVIFHSSLYTTDSYYLASVGSKIFIAPGGTVATIGFETAYNFFKDLLEDNGFKFDPVPISPYKSAHEPLSRSEFSKEALENREWILDSLYDTVIADMAKGLGKTLQEMRDLIDNAPYTDQEAKEKGLVHGIYNEEDLPAILSEKNGRKPPQMHSWSNVRKKLPLERKPSKKRLIAVITAEGTIVDGKSRKLPIKVPIPFFDDTELGDQTINDLVRQAMINKNIKAVVLHVNSRGGSASASESMWASMRELTKKKPLVAYFSDVAASGGYYIAMNAQWIVAQPTTITGSIGVLGGKFAIKEGLKKRGINRVYLRRGAHADLWTDERPFTEEERKIVFQHIRHMYQLFLTRVSENRNKTPDSIEPIAGGRVWSGKQALEHGLVDQLGNIQDAIKKAAELAGLKPDSYRVVNLHAAPPRPPLFQKDAQAIVPELSLLEQVKRFNRVRYWYIAPFKWDLQT